MSVSLALEFSSDVQSKGMAAAPDHAQEYHLFEFTEEVSVGHGLSPLTL